MGVWRKVDDNVFVLSKTVVNREIIVEFCVTIWDCWDMRCFRRVEVLSVPCDDWLSMCPDGGSLE